MESMESVNRMVGVRIRNARRVRGWSLSDVEARSDGEFKASVLGAYERGERALSVARLVRLADIYGVPPTSLFPDGGTGAERVVVDLTALDGLDARQSELVDRFLAVIAEMRVDGLGPTAAVRRSDLQVLAALIGAPSVHVPDQADDI